MKKLIELLFTAVIFSCVLWATADAALAIMHGVCHVSSGSPWLCNFDTAMLFWVILAMPLICFLLRGK